MRKLFIAILLFALTTVEAATPATCPNGVPEEAWEQIQAYLLPENHPVKERLDRIFQESRASSTIETLEEAGFTILKEGPVSHVTVVSHHKLKGYLLKIIRDDAIGICDWMQCLQRASGARAIRKAIQKHDYGNLMKVPRKWIYRMPGKIFPPKGMEKKHFILVVEEMDIYDSKINKELWKSDAVTHKLLRSLYTIIDEEGLYDSVHAINIPFCEDGRIAFIDTEYHHQWPIPWGILKHYLDGSNKEYWYQLTHVRIN